MTEKLYLLLTAEGELSYCFYDQVDRRVTHLETSRFENSKLDDLINTCHQSVFIYAGSCFTLVPSALFDDSHTYNYLQLSHSIEPDATVFYDRINRVDICDVYTLPSAIYDNIKKNKDKVKLRHHSGILLQASTSYTDKDSESVFVNIEETKMDILVFSGEKPILCERFDFTSPTEFIYFILNTYKQLNLSLTETPLLLSGNIVCEGQEYKLAAKHIAKTMFAENKYHLLLPPGIEFHSHFNLLSALLCEL
jgi:hypothetical protein